MVRVVNFIETFKKPKENHWSVFAKFFSRLATPDYRLRFLILHVLPVRPGQAART